MHTETPRERPPRRPAHPVIPGGLTEADHERVHELAELGQKSVTIARAISKHPSTVYWYMAREGLVEVRQVEKARTTTRLGRPVRGFSREEDDFLVATRRSGLKIRAVAEAFRQKFGRPCRPNSAGARLKMLATLDRYDALG